MNKTNRIIQEAMNSVSKDVRAPKAVRDGLVDKKNKYANNKSTFTR